MDDPSGRSAAGPARPVAPRPRPVRYSVVVPCCNEEETLPGLAVRLEALRQRLAPRGPVELVLVDDGSSDGTVATARRLFGSVAGFRLVRHPRNLGLGAAISTGIGAASGSLIGFLDADGTYDPLLLEDLFRRAEDGADVVTASPYHPEGVVEGVGRLRRLPSRIVSLGYRLALPSRLHTYTACVRAFRAEVALRLRPSRPGFDAVAEMICRALLTGHRVEEVPARLTARTRGTSKLRLSREVVRHLRNLGLLWLRRGPYRTRGEGKEAT